MAQQLLWIETLLKLVAGVVLVVMPAATIRLLGLASAQTGFWPRLLGAVLIGMAAASFLEGSVRGSRGLGLGGSILINLTVAAVLASLQVLERGSRTRRGAIMVWITVGALVGLSLVEIAVA
jgi:hypothetical protein